MYFIFFFFNDTATTEIYTLSLHDALPILIPFLTISPTNRISPMNDETLSALRVTGRSAIAPTNERGAARSTTRGSTKEENCTTITATTLAAARPSTSKRDRNAARWLAYWPPSSTRIAGGGGGFARASRTSVLTLPRPP